MTEHFKDLACSETESHIENEELKATLEKVQEQLQSQVAEREAEKEEHRRQMEELQKAREADKEELRKEFMSMLTAQMQGASPQVIVLQDLNLHIYLVSMFVIGIVFFPVLAFVHCYGSLKILGCHYIINAQIHPMHLSGLSHNKQKMLN